MNSPSYDNMNKCWDLIKHKTIWSLLLSTSLNSVIDIKPNSLLSVIFAMEEKLYSNKTLDNTELYVNIPPSWTQTLFPLEIVSHFFFSIPPVSTSLEIQLFSWELMNVIKEIK